MKLLLSIMAVALFLCNYWICLLIYPESNKNWEQWDKSHNLQMNLYAILLFVCFLFSILDTKEWEKKHVKFVLGVGLGLSISDMVDRLLFDVTKFQISDVTMITLTVLLTSLEVYTNFNDKIKKVLKYERNSENKR